MRSKILLGSALLLVLGSTVFAGWFEKSLENVGKKLGNRGVNDTGDAAYGKVKGGVKDAGKDNPPVKQDPQRQGSAPAEGDGRASSSDQDSPASTSTRRGADRESAGTTANEPPAESASLEANEAVYSKYDFIPGDKTIFSDDFSDTDVGEFPRKWHLNGPKGGQNSPIEVVEYQGKRFLRSVPTPKGKRQSESTQYIRLNQKGDLPEKFTVEFDAVFANAVVSKAKFPNEYGLLLTNEKTSWLGFSRRPGRVLLSGRECNSLNTRTDLDVQDEKVHHVSVSVNGTFVKAYVDQVRVVNDPDGVKRPITMVGLVMNNRSFYSTEKVMITNFRLAQGGKDIRSSLDIDGKIVTHGILFDTGKDTIKPESLPTLKMILGVLTDNPSVNFSIEGHTDSQGSKGINQPLSEKRSEAVKAWLVGKGIGTERLKTKGLGDTVPIDSNATAEGRANNRRVEFVKI